ncbi:MAG: hypothetical protein ACFFBR_00250 [Promethearchaeota archaeon]
MTRTRQHWYTIVIIVGLILVSNTSALTTSSLAAYNPKVGDLTEYNYGFINVLNNQSASDINYWTDLALAESNYTMKWHQHVNLSIHVSHITSTCCDIHAFYNFTVNIFNNIVTIFNSTWQTTATLNASVPTPAPTGVSSGLVENPTTQGLPGFFLDDGTLSSIIPGSNILIGSSRWQTVTQTNFSLGGSEQLSYHLFNRSTYPSQLIETTFVIDQDTGIYYQANETTIITINSLDTTLTYYYQVVNSSVALVPPPSPLPAYIVIAVAIVIVIIVVLLMFRRWWRRRTQ